MKQLVLSLVMTLSMITTCLAQKVWKEPAAINMPYTEDAFKVTEVEFKDTETILRLNLKFQPRAKINVQSTACLKADNGQSYKIKSAEIVGENARAIELNKNFRVSDSGELDVALHFDPMPAGIKSFDFIEGNIKNVLKIWSITNPAVYSKTSLFNSNWRNEESGDWEIGLYEDCAVYDSRLWRYKVRKDKKVVLTDGNEDVTVTLGKEKDGKRSIAINGRKILCSRITSKFLPDYPTPDETPFNTELAEGEAVITGWLKDWPAELLNVGKDFEVDVYNVLTHSENTYSAKIDSFGRFQIRLPLTGAQEMYLDRKRSPVATVLEPGETYFLLIDKKAGCTLFMGRNARLQNELLAHRMRFESAYADLRGDLDNDSIIVLKNRWADAYCQNLEKIKAQARKCPTLSRRYLDYHREDCKFTACWELMQLQYYANDYTLPAELLDYVGKTAIINPEVPLSLTRSFDFYLNYLISYYKRQKPKNTIVTPERLLSFKKEGMVYSRDEEATIKKWQGYLDEMKAYSELTDDEERESFRKKISEKYAGIDDELGAIFRRDEFQTFYKAKMPKPFQNEAEVIDSLFSDPTLRDICRARELYFYIDHDHVPLPESHLAVANGIKHPVVRKAILEAHNYYKQLAEKAEVAVKASIRPSSDVEGLTDGKAILDKIVEPYRGRIVYLDIWGTWCSPCKRKLKESPEVKKQLKDYDIVYLYLANRSSEESWKNIIAEYGLTGSDCVHYLLPEKQQDAVERYVGLTGYPTYRLIDKQGNMHKLHWNHTDDMDEFLKTVRTLAGQ